MCFLQLAEVVAAALEVKGTLAMFESIANIHHLCLP